MTLIRVDDGPTIHLAEFDSLYFDDDKRTLKQRVKLAWRLIRGDRIYMTVFGIVMDGATNEPVVTFRGVRLGVRR